MKILKEVLILFMVTVILTTTLVGSAQTNVSISSNITREQPVKVGVLLYKSDDVYISNIRKSLEAIQKANQGKVEFTFFDAKGNQAIQNEIIDSVLRDNFNLILANFVDINTSTVESFIDTANKKNIPVILFPIAPSIIDFIKFDTKAVVIATDVEQSGILQGKILVDAWNTNKEAIDKNRDNILQYVMLTGPRNDTAAIARTKYSVSTINSAGIKTEELVSQVSNWDKQLAQSAIESLFLRYGGKIEAILANSDPMAIGAVEALQKYGYNTGDKTKTIPVVGIDGIPEAQDLIKKGFMEGTVVQKPSDMAQAIYSVGMNLANNKDPLDGTDYKFDETGVVIKIPYYEYIK